jgi:hypothetical protein
MNKTESIKSTYDSRKDGFQYTVSTSVNGKSINDTRDIADPFVTHQVNVSWLDTLKGLLMGGVTVQVRVNGKNMRIIDEVMELNANWIGAHNRTRRDDFNKELGQAISDHVTREMGEE